MLQPGNILAGKYEIKETIGRGAFGRVYRAEEISLGRAVAIKELIKGEEEIGSTDYARFADRFRREARVQAQFNHPNIVHVYELLEPASDAMYLVMEYVDGKSLRDRLAQGSGLPTEEAVRITLGLLEGLAVVHEHPWDVVHRDIKPSNVLLTGKGQPKLADFGVAQVGDETTRTGPGVPHPGTPVYMSPEQAGTTAYLYPASDLFSVGCVLFEMLTGVPYRKAAGMGKSLRDLRPDVPGWLEGIVARSLQKDSERRYRSAQEFAGALKQSPQADGGRGARRARLVPALLGGLALLLVAGLGFGAWRTWERGRSVAATATATALARLGATQTAETVAYAPTNTPTATTTATDTPTATPTPTDTPLPKSTPTTAPAAAPTAAPTHTPVVVVVTVTPTAMPTATSTHTIGPLLEVPTLLKPADGAGVVGRQTNVTFEWSKASRPLDADEYYVLVIEHKAGKDFTWLKEPRYSVGDDKRWLPDFGPGLKWQVVIARQRTGEPNEDPAGAELSEYSTTRVFTWSLGEAEGGGGGGKGPEPTVYP